MVRTTAKILATIAIGLFFGWWLLAGVCRFPGLKYGMDCHSDYIGGMFFAGATLVGSLAWWVIGRIAARVRVVDTVKAAKERRVGARVVAFLSSMLLVFMALCVLIFVYFVIGGHVLPGTPWASEKTAGPMLPGDRQASMLSRCALIAGWMSDGRQCEMAYIDHRDERIRLAEMRRKIDAYLPDIYNVQRLDEALEQKLRMRNYDYHVLTLSPMLIIAVPVRGPKPSGPIRMSNVAYSIPSARTNTSYLIGYRVEIADGSFVFSPDMPINLTVIPDDASSFAIELADSRVQLTAANGAWSVHRVAR